MSRATDNEDLVIHFLTNHKGWQTPTFIEHGITGKIGSSWASRVCIRLANQGVIERNIKGHYCYNGDYKRKNNE